MEENSNKSKPSSNKDLSDAIYQERLDRITSLYSDENTYEKIVEDALNSTAAELMSQKGYSAQNAVTEIYVKLILPFQLGKELFSKVAKQLNIVITNNLNYHVMEASLIIAIIRGSMQAISFWQNQKDRISAKKAIKSVAEIAEEEDVLKEGEELSAIAPQSTIDKLTERVQICFTRYESVLDDDDYLPPEVDKATEALIACICRELTRLMKVNGGTLPTDSLKRYWDSYRCG